MSTNDPFKAFSPEALVADATRVMQQGNAHPVVTPVSPTPINTTDIEPGRIAYEAEVARQAHLARLEKIRNYLVSNAAYVRNVIANAPTYIAKGRPTLFDLERMVELLDRETFSPYTQKVLRDVNDVCMHEFKLAEVFAAEDMKAAGVLAERVTDKEKRAQQNREAQRRFRNRQRMLLTNDPMFGEVEKARLAWKEGSRKMDEAIKGWKEYVRNLHAAYNKLLDDANERAAAQKKLDDHKKAMEAAANPQLFSDPSEADDEVARVAALWAKAIN